MFENLKSDLKSIRKYGLIRHLKYIFDINHVIINLHFDLDFCPRFEPDKKYIIKEISINDQNLMNEWCEVVNSAFAFDSPYNYVSAVKYIKSHSYKNIEKVFLVYIEDKPVASFFVGHFRANNNVACAGRYAVTKEMQGRGLGRYIVLAAMDEMRKLNFKYYEETFNFKRDYSIKLFISCGGFPEFDNKLLMLKPTRKSIFIKKYAQYRVNRLYRNHLNNISKNLIK